MVLPLLPASEGLSNAAQGGSRIKRAHSSSLARRRSEGASGSRIGAQVARIVKGIVDFPVYLKASGEGRAAAGTHVININQPTTRRAREGLGRGVMAPLMGGFMLGVVSRSFPTSFSSPLHLGRGQHELGMRRILDLVCDRSSDSRTRRYCGNERTRRYWQKHCIFVGTQFRVGLLLQRHTIFVRDILRTLRYWRDSLRTIRY